MRGMLVLVNTSMLMVWFGQSLMELTAVKRG